MPWLHSVLSNPHLKRRLTLPYEPEKENWKFLSSRFSQLLETEIAERELRKDLFHLQQDSSRSVHSSSKVVERQDSLVQ